MDFASQNPNAGQRNARGGLIENSIARDVAVWRTVKLGTCKNADEYRTALQKAGCRIGDWANEILGRPGFAASQQEKEVDLVVVSGGSLGFNNDARYSDICARAVAMGLEPCTPEVGPALRLVYSDQPKDEWLRIAMEPIIDSAGYRFIFAVAQDYIGLWLSGVDGDPEFLWSVGDHFVFVRRK